MEDKKRHGDIPSNYVTLIQLQERWIKEQQRKLKEKEEVQEVEEDDKQKHRQQNEEEKEPNPEARRLKDSQTNHRNFNRKYRRRNPDFRQSGCNYCPEENGAEVVADVFVKENENASTSIVKDTKSKGWGNKWKKKRQRNKKEEIKTMEDGEVKAQGGKEETTMPPVKGEGNVPARRYAIRRDRRLEFRPLVISAVQKSDRTGKIKGEVENMVEKSEGTSVNIKGKEENVMGESDGTVEIERKLGNLSLQKEDARLETQTRFVNRSNSQYRGYNRSYNRIVNSSNVKYRVYNSGVKPRDGQDRGSYGRFSRSTKRMIWVKKEDGAIGGEGAGDKSWSNPVKE